MMPSTGIGGRRELAFHDLSEVMPDVRRLESGHKTVGRWHLGQICRHLKDAFVGSLEGFDLRNHRIKRFLIKKQMLKVALTKGIPTDYTVDPNITPPEGVGVAESIGELESAIDRYKSHSGVLHAHPLFGKMPRETWDRVHRIHCAHHLSFAIPE